MKKLTIADIAAHNERAGHYFFSRQTLKHFGQRRSDFRTKQLSDGRVAVYSYVYQGKRTDERHSLAIYDPKTGEVAPLSKWSDGYSDIIQQLKAGK